VGLSPTTRSIDRILFQLKLESRLVWVNYPLMKGYK
jgi:hypothetical protein